MASGFGRLKYEKRSQLEERILAGFATMKERKRLAQLIEVYTHTQVELLVNDMCECECVGTSYATLG